MLYVGSNSAIPHKFKEKVDVNSINEYMAYIGVRESPTVGGRGVFALRDFDAREYVEVCPVINVLKDGIKDGGIIRDYVFSSDMSEEYSSVVLGYGMLYNHSDDPNLSWFWHGGSMAFWSLRKIPAGSELFINYGKGWWEGRSGSNKV